LKKRTKIFLFLMFALNLFLLSSSYVRATDYPKVETLTDSDSYVCDDEDDSVNHGTDWGMLMSYSCQAFIHFSYEDKPNKYENLFIRIWINLATDDDSNALTVLIHIYHVNDSWEENSINSANRNSFQ